MNLPTSLQSLNQNIKPKGYLTIKVQVEKYYEIFVISHAAERTKSNIYNHNPQSVTNANYEEIGVLGELAFEILTGIPMDKRIGVKDPYDFKLRDLEIDIKSTETQDKLSVKKTRLYTNPKYYYVLCRVNRLTYENEFLGWISGDKIKWNGVEYPTNWKVHKSNLNPMISLERIMRSKLTLNGAGVWK